MRARAEEKGEEEEDDIVGTKEGKSGGEKERGRYIPLRLVSCEVASAIAELAICSMLLRLMS